MFKPVGGKSGKEPVKAFNFENFDSNNNQQSMNMSAAKTNPMSIDSGATGGSKAVHPDNRKIYLSGIPKNADSDVVRNIFESFIGEVDDVNIIEQNTLGPFRYGFVTLKRLQDMELCLKLEHITIRGHRVNVKKFKRKKKRALKKREKMVLDDDENLTSTNKSKKGSSKSYKNQNRKYSKNGSINGSQHGNRMKNSIPIYHSNHSSAQKYNSMNFSHPVMPQNTPQHMHAHHLNQSQHHLP
jgi:hypothetical protein